MDARLKHSGMTFFGAFIRLNTYEMQSPLERLLFAAKICKKQPQNFRERSLATDKLIHKLAINHTAAVLKVLQVPNGEEYRASSFTFKEIENRRDLIFEKRGGEEAILLEVQGYDDNWFFHRTVIGRALYQIQKQFTGKLRTFVLFLEQSHYQAAAKHLHHFDGSGELAFQPTIIVLDRKEVSELESLNDVRLVPLYPLCHIAKDQIVTTAPRWAERIKAAESLSEAERRDLLALLGGFIVHRVRELSLYEINQLFGDFKMEDTQVGKDLIAIGVGVGREEGRELGSLETLHENLTELLATKLGRIEKAWPEEIKSIKDLSALKALYSSVLHAKSRKQVKDLLHASFGNGARNN
jgi:hypothetical protein